MSEPTSAPVDRPGRDLDGTVAAITGGAAGIGAATARKMIAHGAIVVVLDRVLTNDPDVVGIECDVTDDASVRAAFDEIGIRYGRLDILVNNAGIGARGDVTANSDDTWVEVFDVNVFGIARVSRAALPLLVESPCAAIVNVGSIAGSVGLPQRALYSATKGAVHALTLAMAADFAASGIRVNAVAPGTVDTPWVGRILAATDDPEAELRALEARQPFGRLVRDDEVAAAIHYLAHPGASATTGTILNVDGGMHGLRIGPPSAGGGRTDRG
jgi:NAD(P)-dependent dehydrogenase (short-subunit alcohol dehydrogenase family)